MNKDLKSITFKTWIMYLILIIIIFIIAGIFHEIEVKQMYTETYEQGYLEACKDFYKGQLKYDLIQNPDGTREWKKIK